MVYTYNKLVRDKIVENIELKGSKCTYKILDDEKYSKELDKKLLEEANEYITDHSIEEMADLMQVITDICKSRNLNKDDIEKTMQQKYDKKGGFSKKIYLKTVEEDEFYKKEVDSKNQNQIDLLKRLDENDSLRTVQNYIKEVIDIRGFSNQPIGNTMLLLLEEVGELAKAIRKNATNMSIDTQKLYNYDTIDSEVADVFIVLTTICNKLNIDLFNSIIEKEKQNSQRVWKKD